jgi:hypothetical protein
MGVPQVLVRLRSTPSMACSPDGGPQVINEIKNTTSKILAISG